MLYWNIDTTTPINDTHIVYLLSTTTGGPFYIGIARALELFRLRGSEYQPKSSEGKEIMLIGVGAIPNDPMKAGNLLIKWCFDNKRPDLQQLYFNSLKKGKLGRTVRCVENGEIYVSATAAAKAADVSVSQMHNHLHRKIGYKRVRGQTYEFKE